MKLRSATPDRVSANIVHGVASLTLDNPGFSKCVGGEENVRDAVERMLFAASGAFGVAH